MPQELSHLSMCRDVLAKEPHKNIFHLEFIYHKAGEHFWIEERRLLRHHTAGEADIGNLPGRGRLQQKCRLCPSPANLFHCGVEAADLARVGLLPHGLLVDTEHLP